MPPSCASSRCDSRSCASQSHLIDRRISEVMQASCRRTSTPSRPATSPLIVTTHGRSGWPAWWYTCISTGPSAVGSVHDACKAMSHAVGGGDVGERREIATSAVVISGCIAGRVPATSPATCSLQMLHQCASRSHCGRRTDTQLSRPGWSQRRQPPALGAATRPRRLRRPTSGTPWPSSLIGPASTLTRAASSAATARPTGQSI
eukprot:scaffold31210_cov110-Isochrysis_galbana.AAC.1